jgi:pimeloyl-ACP methyl ester carboxylesterase
MPFVSQEWRTARGLRRARGTSAEDAFHLVLPSLPGYGFSGEPAEIGWDLGRTARAWAELMRRLGYDRYVAQGGDVGAGVSDAMARQEPAGLIGIHTNLLVPALSGPMPTNTDEERAAAAQLAVFRQSGNGYFVEMWRPMAPTPRTAAAAAGVDGPVYVHDVPRRDLAHTAQLGRIQLPERHLLPRGRQGRPLCRLGGARALRNGHPRSVQVTSLSEQCGRRAPGARRPSRGSDHQGGFGRRCRSSSRRTGLSWQTSSITPVSLPVRSKPQAHQNRLTPLFHGCTSTVR